MKKQYNKLVRDKIPEIILNNNEEVIMRILEDDEYKLELERKLYEEYNEVINSKTENEKIEELADMLEVMISLANIYGKTLNDIIDVAEKKKEKRGGFDKKIYLEETITK